LILEKKLSKNLSVNGNGPPIKGARSFSEGAPRVGVRAADVIGVGGEAQALRYPSDMTDGERALAQPRAPPIWPALIVPGQSPLARPGTGIPRREDLAS
jgi:hypothetical protein